MLFLVAGDDWEMRFTVEDPDDQPFDLSNAQVTWTLLDRYGKRVIASEQVFISMTDPVAGAVSVVVPSTVTTTVYPRAIYNHALRVVSGGITSTPFTGQIDVIADPWGAHAVAVQGTGTNVINFSAKMRKAA